MHSLPARNAYEEVARTTDYGYEALLARKLRSIVRECDRRIEANQRRVEENEREKTKSNPYDEEIADLSVEYEKLMENGELDEASRLETQIAELRAKKASASAGVVGPESGLEPSSRDQSSIIGHVIATLGSHPQYQALRVCDQCGLLLSAKEASKLDDHFSGKLHTGFVQIREKLAEIEKILQVDSGELVQRSERVPSSKEEEERAASVPSSSTATAASSTNSPESATLFSSSSSVVPIKRTRATEGYETELQEPVRHRDDYRQRDRERPRYGDPRDRDYERDRDRDRYSGKDRFRGRRGGGDYHYHRGGGDRRDNRRDSHYGNRDHYEDRRYTERDNGLGDGDVHRSERDAYREPY